MLSARAGSLLITAFLWVSTGYAEAVGMAPTSTPRLQLVQQYTGPFPDTLIQKLYDPQSGVLCYLYIPAKVPNAVEQGVAVYGANGIGSISCLQSAPPPAGKP